MVCVSLIGGSLLIVLIYISYYFGYLSIEAAILAVGAVFIAAAVYETLLVYLITRHMLNSVGKKSDEP